MRWSMACISAGRSAVRHGGLSRARYPASYVASVRPVGVAAGRSQAQPACGLSRARYPASYVASVRPVGVAAGRSQAQPACGLSRARYPASYVASVRPVGVAAGRSQAQPACGLSRACSPKSPGDVVFGLFLLRSEKYVVGPAKFDEIA